MNQPRNRDLSAVAYAVLSFGVFAVVAADFLFVVPDLFNRHNSASDLLAVVSTIAVLACAYIIARFLWRSFRQNGEEE